MESKSKILGHPAHPILIVLPLGLLTASLAFDLRAKLRKNGDDAKVSRALIGAGVLSGVFAAVPGMIDYLAIPVNTRAKRIGTFHAVGNIVMLGLFTLSWTQRKSDELQPSNRAVALSTAGALLSGVTGWLGGELVYRLGVGAKPNAHLNAGNSLTEPK